MSDKATRHLEQAFRPLLKRPGHAWVVLGARASLGPALNWLAEQLAGPGGHVSAIEPDGSSIKIAQIRPLYALTHRRRQNQQDKRIILIQEADLLSAPAQNALLKLLEEPPAGTYFLLGAETEQALAPTIRSRSQLISLPRLSWAEFERQLAGAYPPAEARRRYHLSQGDPLLDAHLEAVEADLNQVKQFLSGSLAEAAVTLSKLNPSRQQVLAWCQSLALLCQGAIDGAKTAEELKGWLARAEAVLMAQRWLKANANHKLAMGWLLLEMRQ